MQGGASMPPPPQYGMRPSQMGGQGVDAGSRSSATVRAPSKPVSAMCGPSAAMEFVEPHKSSRPFSRHPSAHPDYHDSKVVVRPSSRPISDMQATMTTNSPLALLHASHRLTVTLSKLWCHIGSPLVALLMVAMVNMLLPSKVRVRNIRSSLLKWLFVVLTGRMALVSGTTTWVVTAISRRI
jgi:hypothetical protein